jgi:hypothetical protein
MDLILESISTIVFCGVIFGLVWVQRQLFEILFKRFKPTLLEGKTTASLLYKQLVLPATPLGAGGLLAMVFQMYPFPEIFANSVEGKVFYGVFCGLISGWVYRFVKKTLEHKIKSISTSAPAGDSVPTKEIE